jgi:prepilin-type N-terminal cleavage/methylation domain-containing protein
MKGKTMLRSSRGFSLIELIVVMAMFVIVIAVAGDTFTRIMRFSSQQSKTAESNIEGVVGLEMMRKDLASAGFGLPWSFQNPIIYDEVNPGAGAREALAAAYNGIPNSETQTGVPSPVSGGNNVAPGNANLLIEGSDYLVLRATSLGTSAAAQRWSFINYTGATKPTSLVPESWTRENLKASDWVEVIKVGLSGSFTKELVMDGSAFTTTYNSLRDYGPNESKVTHYIYGISDSVQPRMPFNRADYYVRVPSSADLNMLPRRCAPQTGILYKALVKHADGTVSSTAEAPLLDCVADMQVVYTLDSLNNGVTRDTDRLTADTPPYLPLTARQIREQLKLLQVYVLTHEGGKDALYTYPNPTIGVGPTVDGLTSGSGRTFNLAANIGTGWQQYRWKIYRVIVKPANLGQTLQ